MVEVNSLGRQEVRRRPEVKGTWICFLDAPCSDAIFFSRNNIGKTCRDQRVSFPGRGVSVSGRHRTDHACWQPGMAVDAFHRAGNTLCIFYYSTNVRKWLMRARILIPASSVSNRIMAFMGFFSWILRVEIGTEVKG